MSRQKSESAMAFGLTIHYFGHEFARAAAVSLLLSQNSYGLGAFAFVVTTACSFPANLIAEYYSSNSKLIFGRAFTFRITIGLCLLVAIAAMVVCSTDSWKQSSVAIYYIFRDCCVAVLSTQQWSFIVTTAKNLSSPTVSKYAGIVSIACTVGAGSVQSLVVWFGFNSLFFASSICILTSILCGELAYFFLPFSLMKAEVERKEEMRSSTARGWLLNRISNTHKIISYFPGINDWKLFSGNKFLIFLWVEAVLRQCCSNLLHMMFYTYLHGYELTDESRAVTVGRVFAVIHFLAAVTQMFVVPLLFSSRSVFEVTMLAPLCLLGLSLWIWKEPEYSTVLTSFIVLKVLQYSVMAALKDREYGFLSPEIRVQGKQMINFYGVKLGKSVTAVAIWVVQTYFLESFSSQIFLTVCVCLCWFIVSVGIGWMVSYYPEVSKTGKLSDCCLSSQSLDNFQDELDVKKRDGDKEDDYFVGEFAPGLVIPFPVEEETDLVSEYAESESGSVDNQEQECDVVENKAPIVFNMNEYGGVNDSPSESSLCSKASVSSNLQTSGSNEIINASEKVTSPSDISEILSATNAVEVGLTSTVIADHRHHHKARRKSLEPTHPSPLPYNPDEEKPFPAGGFLPDPAPSSSSQDDDFLTLDFPEYGCNLPAGKVVKVRAQSADLSHDPYFGGDGGGGGNLARTNRRPSVNKSSKVMRTQSVDNGKPMNSLPMMRVGSAYMSYSNLRDLQEK